ncbi:MAG TPA: hypothetical protein VHC20_05990 [Candidatus Paceibacterota bacterium]|jgi:hypothetical protein|nr:hypothetical protein [Candidatus Paceibacterota bacterium]
MNKQPDEPEPFSFVFERLVILRAAHKVLSELGMDPDISELLDTAGWLAGDDVDGDPTGVISTPPDDESGGESIREGEGGTGA